MKNQLKSVLKSVKKNLFPRELYTYDFYKVKISKNRPWTPPSSWKKVIDPCINVEIDIICMSISERQLVY